MSISLSPDSREPYASDIYVAHILADMGMPVFCCKLDAEGNPSGAFSWQDTVPGEDSHRAIERWKPGMGLGAVCGHVFDVVDVDPRNGGAASWPLVLNQLESDPPEIFGLAATPSRGAHFWISSQGVARCKLAKGIDLQALGGFVFIAPTVRPSKSPGDDGALRPYVWVSPVHQQAAPWYHEQSVAFAELPWSLNGSSGGGGSRRGRKSPEEWMNEVLAAESGDQRNTLVGLVMEYMFRGIPEAAIADTLRTFLPRVPVFDESRPWYPARGGNPDKWIHSLIRKSASFHPVPDAEADELEGINDIEPVRVSSESPEEISFWESRPVLTHIRDFARARRAAPWAAFGEALAEAICHTPPSLQLPSYIGGNGTLNMLIALTGHSGAGKNAAAGAMGDAFRWTGIIGEIDDDIERVPVGSGEGLVKTYGYNRKNEETKRNELFWERLSAIITIEEIDTFRAMNDRGGATISGELRKFYSGERLGFGYSDISKRVILPKHSYRGCVIAGVQPGRGAVILGDIEGGFAQRWLWLPADDPHMPDDRPPEGGALDWEPPASIADIEAEGIFIMKVCSAANAEIDRARVTANRSGASDIESHIKYTQLKVAAGLALLDGRDSVTDDDWKLSEFVMSVSRRTRESVEQHLRKKEYQATLAQGRAEGIRRETADKVIDNRNINRIAAWITSKLNYDTFTSLSDIKRATAYRDRDYIEPVLAEMAEKGFVEVTTATNRNGSTGKKYRLIRAADDA